MADDSSPIPVPKGSYNFDFDNFDDVNPFQSKVQLGNSPPLNGNNNNKPVEDINEEFDPLSKDALTNSPPVKLVNNNIGEPGNGFDDNLISDKTLDIPQNSPISKDLEVTPKKFPAKSPGKKGQSPNKKSEKDNEEMELASSPKSFALVEPDSPKELDDTAETTEQQVNATDNQTPHRSEIPATQNDDNPQLTSPKKTPTPKKSIKKPKSASKNKTPKKHDIDKRKTSPEANNDATDLHDDEVQIVAPQNKTLQVANNTSEVFEDEIQTFAPSDKTSQAAKKSDLLDDEIQKFVPAANNTPALLDDIQILAPIDKNPLEAQNAPALLDDIQILAPIDKNPLEAQNAPDLLDDIQILAPIDKNPLEAQNAPDLLDADIQIFASPQHVETNSKPINNSEPINKNANIMDEMSCLVSSPEISRNKGFTDPVSSDNETKVIPNLAEGIDGNTSGDDDVTFHDAQQDITEVPVNMYDNLRLANQMTESLDAFHEFGTAENEMPEDNEGFVPAIDIFADSANWELLEKIGGTKSTLTLGRESLYVAFDPFVKPIRPAAEVVPEKEEEITPTKLGSTSISSENDLLLLNTPSPSKLKQRNKTAHPAARKLQDQFDEKKHISDQDVDRLLLSTSPLATKDKEDNMATNEHVVQLVQVMKYSQSEWNKMKQELELTYQAEILNKEKEWSKKLADTQKKLSMSEEKMRKAQQTNEDMRAVVAEFEKTISQLQAERQKSCLNSKQSLQDIMKERDQTLEDLNSVETAFSDLHRRFEKAKAVVESFKQNEEVLKRCVEEHQGKVKRAESKLQALKKQAEDKLEQQHNEMEKLKKSSITDIAKLEAAFKKSEIQIKGLEQSLEQKKKENEELTNICDELISKVS